MVSQRPFNADIRCIGITLIRDAERRPNMPRNMGEAGNMMTALTSIGETVTVDQVEGMDIGELREVFNNGHIEDMMRRHGGDAPSFRLELFMSRRYMVRVSKTDYYEGKYTVIASVGAIIENIGEEILEHHSLRILCHDNSIHDLVGDRDEGTGLHVWLHVRMRSEEWISLPLYRASSDITWEEAHIMFGGAELSISVIIPLTMADQRRLEEVTMKDMDMCRNIREASLGFTMRRLDQASTLS